MNGQLQRLLPHIEELMNQLGEPENVSATDDSGDVAPQTVRIGEASWSNKMVRWDSADARNRTQSDEECGQSGAELVALAALFVPMQKEVQEEIARLVARCLEGPAPWRRGVARVAISNLESKNAATCLQWLIDLLYDPDEKVRHTVGQFFLYATQQKVKLPQEEIFEFARTFVVAPALINGLDGWRDYLRLIRQNYSDEALSLLEAMMDNPDRLKSQLFGTEDWMRIALAIHVDSLCLPDGQARALSVFDKLTRENSGVAHQLLTEWDRR